VRQVLINSGGSTGIFQAFATIINPGDEVVLFDPTYSAYPNVIQYFGGKTAKSLMCEDDDGLPRPDIEALKAAITARTKAVLICNPDNPTGCVFSEGELRAIADLAVDHDFTVVSDEIYQEFIWNDKPHFPIISLPDMVDRTIVIMSFSKTYVWTGCRVGCIISGPTLAPYINRVPMSLGLVPGAFQRAGIVALKEGEDFVEYLRKRYRDAVEYCSKRIDEMPNVSCYMPEATFYLWPDISATGLGEVDFCAKLMEAEKVRIRPGDEYGVKGRGHVRIALVAPMEALVDAMDKMERFVKKL
jgi:aminotransferase